MKPELQFLPPRQYELTHSARRVFDETALNSQSFAMRVAELYLKRTAPDVRNVPFRLGDDPAADMRANAQTLRRYMDGTVKAMPADLEDAWVLALPEPYRSECETALARRRGRLSVLAPDDVQGADAHALAGVMGASGELCAQFGRALSDGRIDARERARMLAQSDSVIAAVLQFRAALTQGDDDATR